MKRGAVIVVLVLAAAIPCGAWSFGLAVGGSAPVGLSFAGAWDPGFSGAALEVLGQASEDWYALEAGIEPSLSPIGWQVLVPLRAGVRWTPGQVSVEGFLEAAPGLSLTRPALFMVGLGAVLRVEWDPAPGFGLFLAAGARVTLCPAWAGYTGISYVSVDAPLTLGVRWFWT